MVTGLHGYHSSLDGMRRRAHQVDETTESDINRLIVRSESCTATPTVAITEPVRPDPVDRGLGLVTRGPQQQRLHEFLDRANQEELRSAGRQWSQGQNLLMDISAQLERMSGDMGRSSDEEFQGQTADAARMSFVASAQAMAAKAAQLEQGADAFEQSATAVDQAIAEREALAQNDGAQPPTRPSTPPGSTDPADVRAQSSYDTANAAYWDRYHADERRATDAITALDQTHTASAEVFKSIHGEPDPVAPGGSGGGGGAPPEAAGTLPGAGGGGGSNPDFDPVDDGGGNGATAAATRQRRPAGDGNGPDGGGDNDGGGEDPTHEPGPARDGLSRPRRPQRPDRARGSVHAHGSGPWHRERCRPAVQAAPADRPPAAASRPASASAWPVGWPGASRAGWPFPRLGGGHGRSRVRGGRGIGAGGPRGAGSSVLGRGNGIAGVGNGAGRNARQRTRGTRRGGTSGFRRARFRERHRWTGGSGLARDAHGHRHGRGHRPRIRAQQGQGREVRGNRAVRRRPGLAGRRRRVRRTDRLT